MKGLAVVLPAAALAGLGAYAVSLGGPDLREALASAPPEATSVTVSGLITTETFPRIDGIVRERTGAALAGTAGEASIRLHSDAYAMPGQENQRRPERLRFDSMSDLREHARLVAGAWPAYGGDTVQAVVSQRAATLARLRAGQEFTAQGRIDGKPVKVRITGIYLLEDAHGPRWADDPMLAWGIDERDYYTTYGPLMVDQRTFLDRFATNVKASWTFVPDLRAGDSRAIAAGLAGLRQSLLDAGCADCTPRSALPATVARLGTVAATSRAAVLGLAGVLGVASLLLLVRRPGVRGVSVALAAALVVTTVSTAATWRTSQADQASHRAGADLRLYGPAEGGRPHALGRGSAFAALPGVTAAVPAYRATVVVDKHDATLVGLDADRLAQAYRIRPDLSEGTVAELAAGLAAGRPALGGLPVPGTPRSLVVEAETPDGPLPLDLVVSDALGAWHGVPVPPLRTGATEVDLSGLAGPGEEIAYPLTVRGFLGRVVDGTPRTATVTALRAGDRKLALPGGQRWTGGEQVGDGLFTLRVADTAVTVRPVPDAVPADGPLPVVVTADLAAAHDLATGRESVIVLERRPLRVKVAGIVDRLPATTPELPAILADWPTLQVRALAAGRLPEPATDWWLVTGDPGRARAELAAHTGWDVTVAGWRDLAAPLAAGQRAALALGLAAALAVLILAALLAGARALWFAAGGVTAGLALAYVAVPVLVRDGQAAAVTPDPALDLAWPVAVAVLVLLAGLSGLAQLRRARPRPHPAAVPVRA
ncbi:hypothetical protein [Nonomuraea sp. SBT364]|uniref:hypothetical protein n=1 Tax=Nonomuraea sp. SBT364 TaxID=1580530 RepID=UPI00066E4A1C|nr:hypothetical protein [Nonomuraea sp. SBT364]